MDLQKKTARVLSIDPGTTNTGIAVLDIDDQDHIHLLFVTTVDGSQYLNQYRDVEYIHGTRYARLYAINKQLLEIIQTYQPDIVGSEAPFYNPRNPGAYGALVEAITLYRTTVFNNCPSMGFLTVAPSIAKQALKVKGTSSNKSDMTQGLLKSKLSYEPSINVSLLDEHSVDAIAVGIVICEDINLV